MENNYFKYESAEQAKEMMLGAFEYFGISLEKFDKEEVFRTFVDKYYFGEVEDEIEFVEWFKKTYSLNEEEKEFFEVLKDRQVIATFADHEEANEYAKAKVELFCPIEVVSSTTGELYDTFRKCELESLDLSVRSFNCLVRAGIETVEQLRNLSFEDLHHIRNMGRRSITEVMLKLLELDGISYDGIKSRLDFVFHK